MKLIVGGLLLLGFLITYWHWCLAVVVVWVVVRWGPGWWQQWQVDAHRAKVKRRQARLQCARAKARDDAAIAARCDQQNAWMNTGDLRGLYGDYEPAC